MALTALAIRNAQSRANPQADRLQRRFVRLQGAPPLLPAIGLSIERGIGVERLMEVRGITRDAKLDRRPAGEPPVAAAFIV